MRAKGKQSHWGMKRLEAAEAERDGTNTELWGEEEIKLVAILSSADNSAPVPPSPHHSSFAEEGGGDMLYSGGQRVAALPFR